METQPISSFQFPPGVRFHPSDEELIVYYLHNKVNSRPLPAAVVGEIELYSYNPWDLPSLLTNLCIYFLFYVLSTCPGFIDFSCVKIL